MISMLYRFHKELRFALFPHFVLKRVKNKKKTVVVDRELGV